MKILMAGLGSIGQRHMRNIFRILGDSVKVSAYRVRKLQGVVSESLTIEEGVELEQKYKFTSYDDLNEALVDPPDAVFICNPSSMHVPVALEAAKKGCHLFIEKPLSHNLEGVGELIDLVEEKRLVTLVGFQLRFHPCFRKLKSLIEDESVGTLLSVQMEVGEHLPAWHKWEDYKDMYASRKSQGGGVVLTQIHEIDYAIDLFGIPKSVYAIGGHYSSLRLDVEDVASVLMECRYKGRALPLSLNMDYLQKPPSRKCKVVGEKGTISMDFHALTVRVVDLDGREEVHDVEEFDRNELFLAELTHFFKCIKGEETSLIDVEKALSGMRTALAIKESMERGEKVSLDN